ncbi:MAG: hypothetical protein HQ569_07400 [Actinobacteria bacterium]|nr:hypothetical protein [Actinomycetota bacterium]
MNLFKPIIKKIKSNDKDLEGMYVITDELGKIICFSKEKEELQYFIGQYNYAKDFQGVRKYKLYDLSTRKKIKKLI